MNRAALAALLTGLLACPAAQAADESFYAQVTKAVFRLQTHKSTCTAGRETSEETLVSQGTGFFVQDFIGPTPVLWVVTARHVVEGADADLLAKVRLGQSPARDVWLYLPRSKWYFLQDGAKAGAFPTDVAVMQVKRVDGYKSFTVCDGDACPAQEPPASGRVANQLGEDPNVPDQVLLLGFPIEGPDPTALEPFARAGVVAYSSRNAHFSVGPRPMADSKVYVIDAFGWPGNSGGPIMNQPSVTAGGIRLLGLLTGSHTPIFDFGIVTPVSSIRATLDAARRANLTPVEAWRADYPAQPRRCAGP